MDGIAPSRVQNQKKARGYASFWVFLDLLGCWIGGGKFTTELRAIGINE